MHPTSYVEPILINLRFLCMPYKVTFLILVLFWGHFPVFSQTINGFELSKALINPAEIKKGGPGRDEIPALNYPLFVSSTKATFIRDSDLVIGLSIGNQAKAYPISILNWHEIVNDSINGQPVAITYCPLCGSGIVFSALVKEQTLTFGVSGLLYNSDVLLYDTQTESLWSQMMLQAINGSLSGKRLTVLHSDLTTWKQWLENHPSSLVLSDQTGFKRNYAKNPYQGYTQTKEIYFPVNATNDKLPPKERVLGIQVKNGFKAYPYSELAKQDGLISDVFKGEKISISFDNESNTAQLISPTTIHSVSSYWFAWYAFHPYTKLYKGD